MFCICVLTKAHLALLQMTKNSSIGSTLLSRLQPGMKSRQLTAFFLQAGAIMGLAVGTDSMLEQITNLGPLCVCKTS